MSESTKYFNVNYMGGFVQGAKSTENKPQYDGNLDKVATDFPTKLRKQIKYINMNSTDVPAIVSEATANTIGVSINTQVNSTDNKFNDKAERLIDDFSELGVGELTNKHHFNSAMRTISDFDLLEGGIIVRHHYNPTWLIPYKYEIVSVDMVDVTKHSTIVSADGSQTVAGLVLNKWQQPTHIWLYDSSDKISSSKVHMSNITYYAEVWHSLGQQIAVSKLSSILPTLDKIDSYATAELNSAIESAKAGAYMKSSAYNEIMQIAFNNIGKLNDFNKQTDQFKTILDQLSNLGVKPNGVTPIPLDDDILFNTSKRDTVFAELNNNSEMKMTSAMGYSDLGVYNKADKVNYSAMKYVSEKNQLKASIRFDNISNKIMKDIHRRLLSVGVSIGRLPNRVEYFKNPLSYAKFKYLRQIHIDVEPTKTASANKTNIELNIKSRKEIVEERTGQRYENWVDNSIRSDIYYLKKQKELYEEAGLEVPMTESDIKNEQNNMGDDDE